MSEIDNKIKKILYDTIITFIDIETYKVKDGITPIYYSFLVGTCQGLITTLEVTKNINFEKFELLSSLLIDMVKNDKSTIKYMLDFCKE